MIRSTSFLKSCRVARQVVIVSNSTSSYAELFPIQNGFYRYRFLSSINATHSTHNTHSSSVLDEEATTLRRVGFIGLGNMGLPMAMNLHKNRVPVAVFDKNQDACYRLAPSKEITVASSAEHLVISGATTTSSSSSSVVDQVIFTMLPDGDAVDAIMKELLNAFMHSSNAASSSLVIVDCSTVSPTTSRFWYSKCKKESLGNVLYVDAPVSGGVKGAVDATLTFMVGCDEDEWQGLTSAQRYLHCMGQKVIHCGQSGAGAATKLCNNLVLAAHMISVSEAMNLGESLDVDPRILASVMNQSTAQCWSCQVNNPHPLVAAETSSPASRNYDGGFATQLMLKDLRLAVAAAQESGVTMPLTAVSSELYGLVRAHGHGGKDFGVILKWLNGQ